MGKDFSDKICLWMYRNPCVERKICNVHRSFCEVKRILNVSSCQHNGECCNEKRRRRRGIGRF